MSESESLDNQAAAPTALMPDLHPVIGRERDAMEEELMRARELLRDGMAKLHGFFDALRASVGAQASLLNKLGDETVHADDRRATLHQLFADHENVLSQSETAILGLQLEDVLGQLLEYTRKRAEGLSTLASALAEAVDHDTLAQNSALQQRLQTIVAQVDERAGSAVQQESLGSGDVELF
jgi:chromosome segregation ATPase